MIKSINISNMLHSEEIFDVLKTNRKCGIISLHLVQRGSELACKISDAEQSRPRANAGASNGHRLPLGAWAHQSLLAVMFIL